MQGSGTKLGSHFLGSIQNGNFPARRGGVMVVKPDIECYVPVLVPGTTQGSVLEVSADG
jgi:hypothetical protein